MGKKIRIARLNKKLTQKELADMLGVELSCVSRWETKSIIHISPDVLQTMAEILEISPQDFLYAAENCKSREQHSLKTAIPLNDDTLELIELYIKCDNGQRQYVKQLMKDLTASKKKT
jgi:transcriptional regulator with XRE-family HTH domain